MWRRQLIRLAINLLYFCVLVGRIILFYLFIFNLSINLLMEKYQLFFVLIFYFIIIILLFFILMNFIDYLYLNAMIKYVFIKHSTYSSTIKVIFYLLFILIPFYIFN